MNKKIVLPLLLILLISAVSAAITVNVTAPNSSTKINSTTTSFNTNFTVSYDGNLSLASNIYLDNDTNNSSFLQTLATGTATLNGANTFSWNTSTLTDGTYYIFVRTTDSNQTAGNYSAGFLVDKTIPSAVTDLNATAGNMQINLIWTASASTDVNQHNIYRSTTNGFTPSAANFLRAVTATNFTDSNVVFGTTYYYILKAMDSAGNLSNNSSQVYSSALDSTAPTTDFNGFTNNAWRKTPATVSLSCSDSGSGCNKTFYKINDANFLQYTAPFTVSAQGTTTLQYYSTDNAGNTETTKTAVIKIDSIAPTAPTGLTATASGLTINLSWTASADVNGSGIKQYYVFRKQDANSSFSLLAVSSGNSYSNTGLTHGTTYYYKVKAGDNADNNSTDSNEASATAMDTTGPSVTANNDSSWHKGTQTITITSGDSDFQTLYYKINGSQFETTTNPKSVEISSEGENSLEFWAKDSYGNEGTHITTSVKIDNTSPNAPSLNSPGASSNGEVSLSWSKPADNPSSANSGIKEYKIYRKTGSENYAVIHTETNPDTLSYTDTGRSQGTTYYYKVTAFDNLNTESDLTNSNEQSVTMPSDSTITTNSGDSVAPSLSWSAPKDGDTITDINVTLKAFASDTSTLQYVSFTFKKETESSYTAITSFQDNLLNGYKTTVWNTSGLENGKYNLKVLARDSPGNVSTKVITVTLNRENIGEKPVEEKPEELVITENMIQEAKDSKTEAMDLISYWKKFNIDFSGDTTIKEANALLEKAEEEMNANNLFASMKDANNSKKLFEAFSSNTKIKVYNSSTTENKEISLSGNLSKENTELKKEISVSREIQFIEVTDGNNTFYQQNIVLTIKNSSDKAKTFKAVELIPKELIENTDSIKSSYAFSVIEKDPVIEWNITLKAGEEKQIVYSLDKKLTKAEADKIIASGNLELFEGNTVLAGEKTKINSNSFKAATTGFISLDSILPIGAGIIVIVILIGIFFFFKGRNSGNGSAKKNEAGSDGLISIYSESPKNGKITLREELNNNKRITPDRNGRFSFKED